MANAADSSYGGAGDAFVTKLDAQGQGPLYSTYLGGSGEDGGNTVAVDAMGNAYVVGATASADFPTVNTLYPAHHGGFDAFVVKIGESQTSTSITTAVLPYARAVRVGELATAFATIINSGDRPAMDCLIALPEGIPADLLYRTTDAQNLPIGEQDTPVDIPAGGQQGFVFGIRPLAAMDATEIALIFDCANSAPASSYAGLNTFILTAAAPPLPDLLAIGATPSNDGVVRLPGVDGISFFAAAAVNIGDAGTVEVSADDAGRGLPLTLRVCETDAAGQWLSCDQVLSREVAAGQTLYYTVVVTATGQPIAFDPAVNRLFLRFTANGTTVGATNVAVTTGP
jgi:hypothetical protein